MVGQLAVTQWLRRAGSIPASSTNYIASDAEWQGPWLQPKFKGVRFSSLAPIFKLSLAQFGRAIRLGRIGHLFKSGMRDQFTFL